MNYRPTTPAEALAALLEGNRRHREGAEERVDHSPVDDPASGQAPFAALITCADSRISPSLIFDLAPGNLFVSRVAGNGVDDSTLGSTEYAVAELGVRVAMVLGHSDCGAVKAAMAAADGGEALGEETHGRIASAIAPVIQAVERVPAGERELRRCVEQNVRLQAERLAAAPPIVATAVEAGELEVVGAVFDIATRSVSVV